MDSTVVIILTLLTSVAGVCINKWAVSSTVNKVNLENAKQTGTILQSISDMRSDIDSFKVDIKEQRLVYNGLNVRMGKLEGKADNLELRVNTLEKRINS